MLIQKICRNNNAINGERIDRQKKKEICEKKSATKVQPVVTGKL
jgi:hypothetical protein